MRIMDQLQAWVTKSMPLREVMAAPVQNKSKETDTPYKLSQFEAIDAWMGNNGLCWATGTLSENLDHISWEGPGGFSLSYSFARMNRQLDIGEFLRADKQTLGPVKMQDVYNFFLTSLYRDIAASVEPDMTGRNLVCEEANLTCNEVTYVTKDPDGIHLNIGIADNVSSSGPPSYKYKLPLSLIKPYNNVKVTPVNLDF